MIHALFLSSTCVLADGSLLMSKVIHVFPVLPRGGLSYNEGRAFRNISYDVQYIQALCAIGVSLLPVVVLGVWEYA